MEQEIIDFDPFEPVTVWADDWDHYIDSEPRRDGRVMITTPLDPSYKWCIPLWHNKFGLIKTPLINPENIRVNA